MEKLHKTQTGIASEFFVAGELARRGFNITLTFGNTKAVDLLVEKDSRLIAIQVKGIQRTKSICWNISKKNIVQFNSERKYHKIMYVFVNLHSDTFEAPEFFILNSKEVEQNIKETDSGRDYIDYNFMVRINAKDQWSKI
ncbi:MAG: hypothetical protein IPO39_15635 [Bacteroidetes bacterium]|nr:hypothetical protein [Bacteroidota bacterium]MBK9526117.1 hypothetical protein [Bacteroidota bacterium]MBK9543680.1 hypothetical protein [Bacteroidota bacterium]MBP6403242.1 hypothetical protein [Bacteroidia bacterium]